MNQEIVDKYLQKKSDIMQSECSCGWLGYMFVDDIVSCFWGKCKKCGKKIYQVACIKCETGFCLTEDKIINQSWKCESCKEINLISVEKETEIFAKDELPPEVLKEDRNRRLPWWVWVILVIILGVVVYIQIEQLLLK